MARLTWRGARVAALGLSFILPASALADTPIPVPKAKPLGAAQLDPEAALSRFVSSPERQLGASVTAYAPAGTIVAPQRAIDEAALYLVAKLAEDGEPIADGLTWRIFREFPDQHGALPLVHKSEGGDLDVRLKPGRYVVHASYGRASVSRSVHLTEAVTSDAVVLDAGGLLLTATLDEEDALEEDVAFELYTLDNGERARLGSVRPGAIARLPAGAYHVVSRYGSVNAVRSADVLVEAGKLTRVSLRHRAGNVSLKLVRDEGGEAIADTAWTIYGDDGEPVFERIGAHATITLAAGEYAVVARHRDNEFTRHFTVESGDEAEVVVLARRL